MSTYSTTDPRRAAEEAQEAEAARTAAVAREAARARADPEVRRARTAFAAGDAILFLTVTVTATDGTLNPSDPLAPLRQADPSQLIAMVEEVGWLLESADHVWIPGFTGRFGVTSRTAGLVQGHYIFRRAVGPLTGPQE